MEKVHHPEAIVLPEISEQAPREVPDWHLLGSHEQKGEHGNLVGQFREAFSEAINSGMKVIDIDKLGHMIKNGDKSIEHQLASAVNERSTGGLCLSPEYQWLEGAGFTHFHARRTSGPKTSSHEVFFGVMHDKPKDATDGIAVAIKPCLTKPDTAINDWVGNSLAHKADSRCYEPIGFFSDGEQAYSITRFKEEGFDTLDKTPWRNVLLHLDDPDFAEQRSMLKDIGGAMAELHNTNTFHGDPQFKNIVHDIAGDMYFIDWESATFYQKTPPEKTLLHDIEQDMRVLFGSMARSHKDAGIGLLDKHAPHAQWSLFKEYIFDPYMDAYLKGSADEQEEGARFDVVSEVEERLAPYVLEGRLQSGLQRNRHTNN